jgi:hypothetical protein
MKHYEQFVKRQFRNKNQDVKPAIEMGNPLLPWPFKNVALV